MKEEDLFSIPDAVTLKEAREDEEFNFLFSKVKSKKPKFDLNKYICFHKELRFGVYKHENKFYLAKIKKYIHVGKYVKPHITKIGELTKHGENWDHLKAGLSGTTFLNKGSESEQLFLQSILEKQRALDEQRIAKEKRAEEKQRKLDEQIAEEKKAEVRQRELDEKIAEEKKAEVRQRELDEKIAEEKKARPRKGGEEEEGWLLISKGLKLLIAAIWGGLLVLLQPLLSLFLVIAGLVLYVFVLFMIVSFFA